MLEVLRYLIGFIFGFIAIGLVVFIHELGHFFTARALKVEVETLSFGMGPKVLSIYGKNTEYRLSLLPFGGYCRMKGSLDLEKALRDKKKEISLKEEGSYFAVHPIKRILIYIAGPFTNFLLAFILLFIAAIIPVERLSHECYIAPISDYPKVFELSYEQKGIKKGDLVLNVDGITVRDYEEFVKILREDGESANLEVLRNGEIIETTIFPIMYDGSYTYGITLLSPPIIGISSDGNLKSGDKIISVNGKPVKNTLDVYSEANSSGKYRLEIERGGKTFYYNLDSSSFPFSWHADIVVRPDVPFSYSFRYALKQTNDFFITTLRALSSLITLHFSDAREIITGPVNAAETISSITTEAFSVSGRSGIRTLCYLLSIVSISICIGNILPIPTFDGGQVLISFAELIRRDSLKARTYVVLQIIGMVMALLIMITMYYFDIRDFLFR